MPTTIFVLFDVEIDWINQKITLDSSIARNDNCPPTKFLKHPHHHSCQLPRVTRIIKKKKNLTWSAAHQRKSGSLITDHHHHNHHPFLVQSRKKASLIFATPVYFLTLWVRVGRLWPRKWLYLPYPYSRVPEHRNFTVPGNWVYVIVFNVFKFFRVFWTWIRWVTLLHPWAFFIMERNICKGRNAYTVLY